MAGLRQVVDPPSFSPIPFGLLTTVEFPNIDGAHWQNGITYQPLCSSSVTGVGASTYDPSCIAVTGAGSPGPPSPPALASNFSQAPRGATSFVVYAEFDCATVGNEQAQQAAERALAMAEPWQVEHAFWTGLAGGQAGAQTVVFPHLAANAQVLDANGILLQTQAINVTGVGSIGVTGDTTNITTALGLLEGALANCYDGVGVIHVPQLAVPSIGGLINSGPQMKTKNGNLVAIGAGYPGTGPDGSVRAGNTVWLYATGNVFGFRSAIRVRAPQGASSINRSTNTISMIAERTYVLGWDCCHFAVQAALGAPKGT